MLTIMVFTIVGICIGCAAGYKYTHDEQTTRIHLCDPDMIDRELHNLELPYANNTTCPICGDLLEHSENHFLVLKENQYFEVCEKPICQYQAESEFLAS